MYRTILCAAAGTVIFAMPARADETLKFRNVEHLTSNQNQRIDSVERHFMGVVRSEGVATFSDGSTGTTLGVGAYDVVVGSGGTNNGYTTLTFTDGSELWFKWAGTIKWGETKNIETGTAIVVGGKGRYAGAKGDATWEGEATRGANAMGEIDNVVNIKSDPLIGIPRVVPEKIAK
jgi:hypothetical protein